MRYMYMNNIIIAYFFYIIKMAGFYSKNMCVFCVCVCGCCIGCTTWLFCVNDIRLAFSILRDGTYWGMDGCEPDASYI